MFRLTFFILANVLLLAWLVNPAPAADSATTESRFPLEWYGDGGDLFIGEAKRAERAIEEVDKAIIDHRHLLAAGLLEARMYESSKAKGDRPRAIKLLERAREGTPNSSVALVQLAELYLQSSPSEATTLLDRAEKADPDYYRTYLVRAFLLHRDGSKKEECLAALGRCLELKSTLSQARQLRVKLVDKNSPDSLRLTIEDYQRLEQALPQQRANWEFHIGWCYYYLKDYPKALKYLEPLIGTMWREQAAYYIGRCKQAQGDYKEALDILSLLPRPQAKLEAVKNALILADSSQGEERGRYLDRALEELNSLLAAAGYRDRTDLMLKAGKIALERNRLSEAIKHLISYTTKMPNDIEAKDFLLQAYFLQGSQGDAEEAEKLFQAVAAIHPATETVTLRLNYLNYLIGLEDWEKVDREVAALRDLSVDSPQFALIRARIAFGKQDYSAAISAASSVVDLLPEKRDAIYLLMGRAYLGSGSKQLAENCFQHSIASVTDSHVGLLCYEIGELYSQHGMSDEQVRYWQKALEIHPGQHHRLRYEIGRAYLFSGSHELAVPIFETIANSTGERDLRSQTQTLLGYISLIKGATREAEEHYKAAIEIWPLNNLPFQLLGQFLSSIEDFEGARENFERAVALEPGDATTLIQLGIACDKLDDVTGAEKAAHLAMKVNKNYAEAYNFLGYLYAERGIKLDAAVELIGTAMKIEPNNPNITDSLGWAYFQKGEYEKAIEQLEKAVGLITGGFEFGSSVIFEHLGDAYQKAGQSEKAREMWKNSLEGDPKSETAQAKITALDSPPADVEQEQGAAAPK